MHTLPENNNEQYEKVRLPLLLGLLCLYPSQSQDMWGYTLHTLHQHTKCLNPLLNNREMKMPKDSRFSTASSTAIALSISGRQSAGIGLYNHVLERPFIHSSALMVLD